MAKTRKAEAAQAPAETEKTAQPTPDGFINVPVTRATRDGLHTLKKAMGVPSQAEVIERLVVVGLAISQASR